VSVSAAAKALDALEAALKASDRRVDLRKFPHANHDFRLEAIAVNLSSPLAAVARAAMARPWWRPESPRDPQFYRCVACRSAVPSIAIIEDDGHYDGCPMAKLDAALDALEAAAAEGGGA